MHYRYTLAFLLGVFLVSSCTKVEYKPDPPTYVVPTSYNFPGVDYSNQRIVLGMFEKLDSLIDRGNIPGTSVDKQQMLDMYSNTGNPFNDASYNASGVSLKDLTKPSAVTVVEQFMDSIAKASLAPSTTQASNGVAGVAVSKDGTKKYLLNAKGFDYSSALSKLLMGAVLAHQISEVYLSDTAMGPSVDTATKIYYWNQAFGLFGVPRDFPTDKTDLKYLGGYSDEVDPAIHSNPNIMNGFLVGRSALDHNDTAMAHTQAKVVLRPWVEKLLAASAIHELNEAKEAFSDDAVRNHVLSEGYGFMLALDHMPGKKISHEQISTIIGYFGNNLYTISLQNINDIISTLSTIYGLETVQAGL